MTQTTITKSIFLKAPREVVWAFLTEKEKLALWFNPAEADLALGAEYALLAADKDGNAEKICWGEVLEMEKPTRLVYSFTIKPLAGAMTKVTWDLQDVMVGTNLKGTKLSLTHEGISEAAGEAAMGLLLALDAGWDAHLLDLRQANA
jgi:uncharacterized protein YndB with AHSA1/START domain